MWAEPRPGGTSGSWGSEAMLLSALICRVVQFRSLAVFSCFAWFALGIKLHSITPASFSCLLQGHLHLHPQSHSSLANPNNAAAAAAAAAAMLGCGKNGSDSGSNSPDENGGNGMYHGSNGGDGGEGGSGNKGRSAQATGQGQGLVQPQPVKVENVKVQGGIHALNGPHAQAHNGHGYDRH